VTSFTLGFRLFFNLLQINLLTKRNKKKEKLEEVTVSGGGGRGYLRRGKWIAGERFVSVDLQE
jgi:hypothetical protein